MQYSSLLKNSGGYGLLQGQPELLLWLQVLKEQALMSTSDHIISYKCCFPGAVPDTCALIKYVAPGGYRH